MKHARMMLIALLLALFATPGASAAPAEDYPVDQFPRIPVADRTELYVSGHTYYKVEPGDYSWAAAEAICEAQGAHLVTITTLEEAALINQMTEGEDSAFWVGAYAEGDRAVWVTGETYDPVWMNIPCEIMESREAYNWHMIYGNFNFGLMKFGEGGYGWCNLPELKRKEPKLYEMTQREVGFIMEWDEDVRELFVTMPEDQRKQTYTGSAICPKPIVTDQDDKVLVEGTDYTLSYEDNIKPGIARVLVSGEIGGYNDGEAQFKIIPRPVKDLKVVNYTGNIKLEWTPREEADGYQVKLWPMDEPEDIHFETVKEGGAGKIKIRRDYLKYGKTYRLEVQTFSALAAADQSENQIEDSERGVLSEPAEISTYYRESYLEIGIDTNSFPHNRTGFGIGEGEKYEISDELYNRIIAGEKSDNIALVDADRNKNNWNGSCHGLVLSVVETKIGNMNLDLFKDENGVVPQDYYHLSSPGENGELKHMINAYHFTQYLSFGEPTIKHTLYDAVPVNLPKNTRGDVMRGLIADLSKQARYEAPIPLGFTWLVDPGQGIVDSVYNSELSFVHNHTVIACGLEMEEPGYVIVTIYDVNDTEHYSYLFIDKGDPAEFEFSYSKESIDKIPHNVYPDSSSWFSHMEYWNRSALNRISKRVNGKQLFTCPSCGFEVYAYTAPSFCTNCGAPLAIGCPFCGHWFIGGIKPTYCTNCGAKLK